MDPIASAKTFIKLKERLHRLLKRVAAQIEASEARPTPTDIVDLCTASTLMDCKRLRELISVDDWPGGYIFLYWAIDDGPKWLRRIIKEEQKVKCRLQESLRIVCHLLDCLSITFVGMEKKP